MRPDVPVVSHLIHFDQLPIGRSPVVVGAVSSACTLSRADVVLQLRLDVAELRLDLTGPMPGWIDCADALRRAGRPVLLTLRSAAEGGRWTDSEAARLEAYAGALDHVAAVDVEVCSEIAGHVVRAAHEAGRRVVLSFHAFDRMPSLDELRRIVDRGSGLGADIVKIAARTETRAEVDRLAVLLAGRGDRLLCCVGMGAMGPASRVELALAGSCLTYGYADECNAPGQLSSGELLDLLAAHRARPVQ